MLQLLFRLQFFAEEYTRMLSTIIVTVLSGRGWLTYLFERSLVSVCLAILALNMSGRVVQTWKKRVCRHYLEKKL